MHAEGARQVLPSERQSRVALQQPRLSAKENLLEEHSVGSVDGLDTWMEEVCAAAFARA